MAITINGDGTLTGVSVGGLPDGIVDTDMLATDAVSAAKLQSTAIASGDLPSGSVLQVVKNTTDNTGQVTCNDNTADISFDYLTLDITPISSSSTIYVSWHLPGEMTTDGATYNSMMYIRRRVGSTNTYLRPAAAGSRNRGMVQLTTGYVDFNANSTIEQWTMTNYPDTHGVTAGTQITYFPALEHRGGSNATWHYNRTVTDSDADTTERGRSWIMAMEVAG